MCLYLIKQKKTGEAEDDPTGHERNERVERAEAAEGQGVCVGMELLLPIGPRASRGPISAH